MVEEVVAMVAVEEVAVMVKEVVVVVDEVVVLVVVISDMGIIDVFFSNLLL